MACEGLLSAQARPVLKIVVVEGEGAINNIQLGITRQPPVVQVSDENDKPVAGANVTFLLPERGPGGTFFGTWRNVVVTTDQQGRATGAGFRPNSTEGDFQIQVTAVEGDRTGTANITQSNVTGSNVQQTESANRGPNRFRQLGRRKILIGVLAAGAIIAAVVATRGGNDESTSSTPGTTITPGTVSVGTPR
jgi:hypothetical protein